MCRLWYCCNSARMQNSNGYLLTIEQRPCCDSCLATSSFFRFRCCTQAQNETEIGCLQMLARARLLCRLAENAFDNSHQTDISLPVVLHRLADYARPVMQPCKVINTTSQHLVNKQQTHTHTNTHVSEGSTRLYELCRCHPLQESEVRRRCNLKYPDAYRACVPCCVLKRCQSLVYWRQLLNQYLVVYCSTSTVDSSIAAFTQRATRGEPGACSVYQHELAMSAG